MNPRYGQVVGIDVGETRVSAEMFDLTMARLTRADHLLNPRHHSPAIIADHIASSMSLLMDGAGEEPAAVIGVGIGVPGSIMRDENGLSVVHAESYGWDSVPFERLLRERLGGGYPVLIENGAMALGQAELWFGSGQGTKRAVACLIGSGVGASVITNGVSTATEWGHTAIVAGGRPCRCGSRGCIEAYVGGEAILDRYGLPLPGDDEESALATLVTTTSQRANEVLDETATLLGIGIANLINLFTPDRVILGGWAGQLLTERILPAIRESARQHALPHKFVTTTIERGALGPDAIALGAATLPISHFLNAPD
jgi:predicted NBD/HSP70 family sugar kinase